MQNGEQKKAFHVIYEKLYTMKSSLLLGLIILIIYSCSEDSLEVPTVTKRILIKETYYSITKENQIQGYKIFNYDSEGNINTENKNDTEYTYYKYDNQNRLIYKHSTHSGISTVKFEYSYPSSSTKIEIVIFGDNDTSQIYYYTYDNNKNIINKKSYSRHYAFTNNDLFKLKEDVDYEYYDDGVIKSSYSKNYNYYTFPGSERLNEFYWIYNYDRHGNPISSINKASNDSVISNEEYLNTYDNNILTSTYNTKNNNFTYKVRYEFDELNRVVRKYDKNDYLILELFYEGEYICEQHNYYSDNYGEIPNFRLITVYDYE